MSSKNLSTNLLNKGFGQTGSTCLDHIDSSTYSNNYHSTITMVLFKAFYGRKCRSQIFWFQVAKIALIGLEPFFEAITKGWLITERLRMILSQKQYYAYVRRGDLEFEDKYLVYIKISPIKCSIRFDKKGQLNPRYVGPHKNFYRCWEICPWVIYA